MTALVGAVKSLTNAFKGALDNYAHFEKMEMGLTTFFQDAEKGKKQFEEIRKLSNETTFGVDELADSFTQLANVGINTNTIKDKLVMLGNLASGDKAKFAELTSIYAKIQSTGKAGAMQLQQIASRGIPIYDILKKMGVQGTATGEQITKAFEQMTEEGGQFYNAMENINETIEGKEGFIADYFKEFTVNFAEVSGIADAYKNTLDILKERIGAVSDKLLEWNNNPIAKAILRGTLVAGVTALTVAIGVGLVGAISTLNKKLAITATLKAIINPTAVALTVGISAVLGLATALETATTQAGKYVDKIKEIQEEEKKNQYGLNDVDLEKAYKNKSKGTASTKELLAIARRERSEAEINAKILQEQTTASGGKNYQSYLEAEKKVKAKKQEYEIIEQIYQREVGIYKADEKTVNAIKDQVTEFDEFVKKLGDAEKNYSSIFKKEQELKEIEAERKKYLDFVNKQFFGTEKDASGHPLALSLSDEEKKQYEKDLKAINKKYKELQIEVRIGNLSDIEKNIQKVLGLSDEEVWKLDPSKDNQSDWIQKATEYALKKQNAITNAYKVAGINQSITQRSTLSEQIQAEKSRIESFASLNVNGEYNQAIKESTANLNALSDEYKKAGGTTKELDELLGNTAVAFSEWLNDLKIGRSGVGGQIAGAFIGGVSSASKDMSNAIQGFEQGGWWGAIINTVVSAFFEVAQSVEGFEEVMNPVTTAMEELKPFIQWLVGKLADYTKHLEAMFTVIGELFEVLEPLINDILDSLLEPINATLSVLGYLLKLITPLIKAVADVLHTLWSNTLGKLVGGLKGLNDSFAETRKVVDDTKKAEEERLRALTNAYSNMLSTLRDVQEEYEKRKKYINAQGYADSVTGVHDMILTPQGKFSTDPDDYIIATKNPSSLNGGLNQNVIINNYTSDNVETRTDDNGNLIIQISQKVAYDYANGNNGWDSAVQARQARLSGRSLAM